MAMTKSFGYLTILLLVSVALTFDPTSAVIDWRVCGRGMSAKCGQIISSKVNLNEGPLPDGECCRQLVRIGKPCHDAFTQAHILAKDFEGTVAGLIKRSNEVWEECVGIADLVSDHPATGAYAPDNAAPARAPAYQAPAGAPAGRLDAPEDV